MTTTVAPNETVRSYPSAVPRVLLAAFTLSAAHTLYITLAGLATHDFNALAPAAWAFYALGFGLAAAARSDRRGLVWTTAGALTVLLLVAVFYYPLAFTPKLQNTFGWFENDVYTGLLMIALYLTVERLRSRPPGR